MSFMHKFVPSLCIVGFLSVTLPQNVYSQAYTPNTCEFGGRVGKVIFTNDSLYPIRVKIYYSNSGNVYSSQKVKGGATIDFGYNAGDDWGIQLGGSKVKCVGSVAQWENNAFSITVSDFYK